jgi:GNAT superfamily N-acetyltransferase
MLIREARVEDAPTLARVHVDAWRTTYPGIVPDEYLASLSYSQREEAWRICLTTPEYGELTYLAEDDERQVIGFATGGPERTGNRVYPAELHAIYLLSRGRRLGLGTQLVRTVAGRLVQLNYLSLMVWVLAENPSRAFYEALGGEKFKEAVVEIGGAKLVELAYGWKDIRRLTESLESRSDG